MTIWNIWDYKFIRHIAPDGLYAPLCGLQSSPGAPFSSFPPCEDYQKPCAVCQRKTGVVQQKPAPDERAEQPRLFG